MEERKRNYTLPWWIKLIACVLLSIIVGYTLYLFGNEKLSMVGLILSEFLIIVTTLFYYMFDGTLAESMYEDEIDELTTELECIDKENSELRKVVDNYSKETKKTSKKTKKANECKDKKKDDGFVFDIVITVLFSIAGIDMCFKYYNIGFTWYDKIVWVCLILGLITQSFSLQKKIKERISR